MRLADGGIYGDNTDAYGFEKLLRRNQIAVKGKKALVLGSGGASVMACHVLRELGAKSVTVISRKGEDRYDNLEKHADAELIVNTTPVGMYPNNGQAAVDLKMFPGCTGVVDVVYNPARTALLLQSEKLGIPCAGGLYMLVGQAKRSSELFTGKCINDREIDLIESVLRKSMQNLILIGMPGCGKSTVAAALGEKLGRSVYEADAMIVEEAECTIPEIFEQEGEESFRRRETKVLGKLGKCSGAVISTGGGCVTRPENYDLLHQNGCIIWLKRDLDRLPREGRPLSLKSDLHEMYAAREPLYERFADFSVENDGSLENTVNAILEGLK